MNYYQEISPLGKPIIEKLIIGSKIKVNLKQECRLVIYELETDHGWGFNLCSALKYLWRLGEKPGASIQGDCRKVVEYLQWEIEADVWVNNTFLLKTIAKCKELEAAN